MRQKERAGFVLYFDDLAALADVMNEACLGRFILALSHYAQKSIVPTFTDDNLRIAFGLLRAKIDRDREHYAEISEKRAEAARKRVDEKERLLHLLQRQPYGTGIEKEDGIEKEYGGEYGITADPRITTLERLKSEYAEEVKRN